MLKASGKFYVTKDSIKIVLDMDFCRYYNWLFTRAHYFTKKLQLPKHGAHIGIINQKIHKKDCSDYLYLNGQAVDFQYDIEGNYGGFSKGFLNFWMDVTCKEAEEILREMGCHIKTDGFGLLHITVGNNKNL